MVDAKGQNEKHNSQNSLFPFLFVLLLFNCDRAGSLHYFMKSVDLILLKFVRLTTDRFLPRKVFSMRESNLGQKLNKGAASRGFLSFRPQFLWVSQEENPLLIHLSAEEQ